MTREREKVLGAVIILISPINLFLAFAFHNIWIRLALGLPTLLSIFVAILIFSQKSDLHKAVDHYIKMMGKEHDDL